MKKRRASASKETKKPAVHGHRGSRGTHTENSIPSFEEAVLAGSDFIELDVQMSADEVPVVYHDNFLSGRLCRDPKGEVLKKPLPIRSVKAQKIVAHTLGTYAPPRFAEQKLKRGQHIPTLDEVFTWKRKKARNVGLNVELKYKKSKRYPVDLDRYAEQVIALVRKHGLEQEVLIQSFDRELLECVRKQAPDLKVSRLYHVEKDFLIEAKRMGYPNVSLNFYLLSDESVRACREAGIGILTYTVNRPRQWAQCAQWGIDAIITDYPRALRKFLSHSKITPRKSIK